MTPESAIVSFQVSCFKMWFSKVMSTVIHCALEGSLISLANNTTASVVMGHNVHACFECVVISLSLSILHIDMMVLQYIFFTGVSIIYSRSTCTDFSLIIMFVDVSTIGVLHGNSSDALLSSKSWKCYHIDKFKNN